MRYLIWMNTNEVKDLPAFIQRETTRQEVSIWLSESCFSLLFHRIAGVHSGSFWLFMSVKFLVPWFCIPPIVSTSCAQILSFMNTFLKPDPLNLCMKFCSPVVFKKNLFKMWIISFANQKISLSECSFGI